MAGEVMLINPRRHRRRHKKAARKRRRTHARAHNPVRHRRHRYARRHNPRRHRRHYRRNPAFGGGGMMKIAGLSAGYIVTDLAGAFIQQWIPPSWGLDANLQRIGAKAVIGIGAPMLLKRFLPRGWGNALAIGGGIAVAVDIFDTYVKGMIPGITPTALPGPPGVQSYELLSGSGTYEESVYQQ